MTPLALHRPALLVVLLAAMMSPAASAQKRALVVSGGGAKGAYAAGVLSVLMRDRARDTAFPAPSTIPTKVRCVVPEYGSLRFDVLVGTSTGALITPLAHQRRIREMTRFYTTYGTADVLTQRPIFEALTSAESFYTVDQLRRLLLEDYAATGLWDGIQRDSTRLLVVTGVDLQRSTLVLFYAGNPSNRDVAEVGFRWQPIADETEFLEAILASSSEPVGMPPVRWKNSLIWDGGVRSAIPLSVALAQHKVEEVWVIALNPSPDSPMGWNPTAPATGLQVLMRTIDVFGNNVAANDLTKMDLLVKGWRERARRLALGSFGKRVLEAANSMPDSVRKGLQGISDTVAQIREEGETKDTVLGVPEDDQRGRVQVFLIRPFERLPGSSLENTLHDQQRMYLSGQKDARHFLTWLKEECVNLNRERDTLSVLFRVFAPTGQ